MGLYSNSQNRRQGNVGEAITNCLVVIGDPSYSTSPGHPRGAMLRAYDQKIGQQVGEVWIPAPQSGSPMTYSYDGKQYIVAVSGGNYSGEYIAFSLPLPLWPAPRCRSGLFDKAHARGVAAPSFAARHEVDFARKRSAD